MEKTIIKSTLLIIFILNLLACEKEIKIKSDNFVPQLVINSILNTDTLLKVQISHTTLMTDTLNDMINNATVELWQNDGLIGNLPNTGDGIYTSESIIPTPGNIYLLKVSAPGYSDAIASDTMPEPVQISDGYYIFPAGTDINDEPYVEFVVSFNDPPNVDNYYEMVIITKGIIVENNDSIALINYYYDFLSTDPVLISEGDMDYHPVTIYFSDKLFNGKSTSIAIKTLARAYGYHYGVYDCAGGTANLRSISYANYQYLKKWTRHFYNQGISLDVRDGEELRDFIFIGEPVTMYTNVQGGYGIFASYSASSLVMSKRN